VEDRTADEAVCKVVPEPLEMPCILSARRLRCRDPSPSTSTACSPEGSSTTGRRALYLAKTAKGPRRSLADRDGGVVEPERRLGPCVEGDVAEVHPGVDAAIVLLEQALQQGGRFLLAAGAAQLGLSGRSGRRPTRSSVPNDAACDCSEGFAAAVA
jgi:hypothetical protein